MKSISDGDWERIVARTTRGLGWAQVKRRQASQAEETASVASGIGEYDIANACYRLAGLLRREAEQIEERNEQGETGSAEGTPQEQRRPLGAGSSSEAAGPGTAGEVPAG